MASDREGSGEEGSGLADMLRKLSDMGEREDEVSIGDVQEEIGERSFGPFLLIPAIIEVSPIGGIPGLPTALALIIALFAVQILFGRKHLWLPEFVRKRSVKGDKLARAMGKMQPVARWTDKLIKPRLRWATKAPWTLVVALLCLALCASVPPLELIPFASTAPMGTIALFGLGLTARDGLLVCLGFALSAVSAVVVYMSFA